MTKSTAREDDALWAAVGDPTRRQLLDALLARGGASATALAADLPVTRQAVAKHLAVLDRAGLVRAEKVGREVIYAVRTEELDEVSRSMAKVAAGWDQRLARIKALAESSSQ
ncbi:MAG TPA: metalloregulator ArsR/SmtB family transcription factor [Solirubrobacterales bacterium]|nr:metalloregulator ArsR/SmtB family transcription factor [Solirubrobacterales bacterium]